MSLLGDDEQRRTIGENHVGNSKVSRRHQYHSIHPPRDDGQVWEQACQQAFSSPQSWDLDFPAKYHDIFHRIFITIVDYQRQMDSHDKNLCDIFFSFTLILKEYFPELVVYLANEFSSESDQSIVQNTIENRLEFEPASVTPNANDGLEDAIKMQNLYQKWHTLLQQQQQSNHQDLSILEQLREPLALISIRHCIETQNGNFNMPYCEFNRLSNIFGKGFIIELISSAIAHREIGFPFKRYGMPCVKHFFNNLCFNYPKKSQIITTKRPYQPIRTRFQIPAYFFPFTYQGKYDNEANYVTLTSTLEDYDQVDIITDYFQEYHRMKARRSSESLPPFDWWFVQNNNIKILEELIQRGSDLNMANFRESMLPHVNECTQFKATLAQTLIVMFDATNMLDFSAGWGDRLIGALASTKLQSYLGVDPNINLKKGHDEIITTLATLKQRESKLYRIIYEPFQTLKLPEDFQVDFVFTSPPYFDLEEYSPQQEGQSIKTFPIFSDWCVRFLFASLKKAWKHLVPGGHMAIHITDTYSIKCCQAMNLFIESRLEGSFYEGVIISKGFMSRKLRFIWIWRKESKGSMLDNNLMAKYNKKALAEQFGRRYHPVMWNNLVDIE